METVGIREGCHSKKNNKVLVSHKHLKRFVITHGSVLAYIFLILLL